MRIRSGGPRCCRTGCRPRPPVPCARPGGAGAADAGHEDLTGLPPAWIGVGDLDLFHDEDLEYARRLEKAGVPVTVRVEPGMYHAAEIELHATTHSMRAFQEDMFDAVAAALA